MSETKEPMSYRGVSSLGTRLEILRKLERGIRARREEIIAALATDLGKPAVEGFLAEYFFVLQEIRLVRRKLKKWLKPRKVKSPIWFWPCRSRIELDPYGRVLVIAPWNYPIQLALAPVISAVAAGNSVVLKPSEMTPTCAALLEEILSESCSSDLVKVEQGGKDVAEDLLEGDFDFIFFTGSTEVGRSVAEKAGRKLTPTILELGGKCPCLVDATADIEITAKRILIGKFFNAGQTCFAPDFIAVEKSVHRELVEKMESLLIELPWEEDLSRVINQSHFDRLLNLRSGDEVRKGEDDREALRMAPRILPKAKWDDAVMKEEIFGPLLPIVIFENEEELLAQLRDYGSPLALYLFSRDARFIEKMKGDLRSGSMAINDTMKQACSLELPFGGVGASGSGRYRGKAGVEAFCYERAVMKRYFVHDLFEMLPPRDGVFRFLKKWLPK